MYPTERNIQQALLPKKGGNKGDIGSASQEFSGKVLNIHLFMKFNCSKFFDNINLSFMTFLGWLNIYIRADSL
jgi:hypothetical protein